MMSGREEERGLFPLATHTKTPTDSPIDNKQ